MIWSGRVVFIGRDAALEGVIANAVRAGFPPCHPSCPGGPARVQGPGGQVQASLSYVTPGLAVGLGSTQPGGIITALDAGMNWARDKSLFDLAFRG